MRDEFEQKIEAVAGEFHFPLAPDVVGRVSYVLAEKKRTRLVYHRPVLVAFAILVTLLVVALIVPQSRASLLTFLRVGAVDIELTEAVGEPQFLEEYASLAAHEMSLQEASARSEFPLLQPAGYPEPDMVFWQTLADSERAGGVTIFVWLDDTGQAELSLYQIDASHYGLKQASVEAVIQTSVDDYFAFWLPGPHQILLSGSENSEWQLVGGNVLVWTDNARTFRIESGMSLAETVAVAESLR